MATILEDDYHASFIDVSKGNNDVAELADSMGANIPGTLTI
jgi:hypothetical protein